jgi:hypothetical protein
MPPDEFADDMRSREGTHCHTFCTVTREETNLVSYLIYFTSEEKTSDVLGAGGIEKHVENLEVLDYLTAALFLYVSLNSPP